MKFLSLILTQTITLATLAQSTIPLMIGTNGNVLAPANFWATAPVLIASEGRATNATFCAPRSVTNYDTSLLTIAYCSNSGALGAYSNVTGHAYEYAMNSTEVGADYWTTVANGVVRLYAWQNPTPLAQCSTNSFPGGLGGSFRIVSISTNSTAITALGDVVARDFKGRFAITVNGQTATIAAGALTFADGSSQIIPAGSVRIAWSATNFITLDLQDFSYHAWRRAIDRGSVCLGSIVTSTNSVLNISQPVSFDVPASRISRTRAKLLAGQPVRVLCLGDSTTAGSGSTGGSNWVSLLLSPSMTNQAVSLGKTSITVQNMGVGGQLAKWGLACLGNTVSSPVRANVDFPYWAISKNHYIDTENASPASGVAEFPIIRQRPDLAIICFGANSATNSQEELGYLESAIHRLRKRDVEVILWNGYYRADFASIQNVQFDKYRVIADWQGCEFIDTFSRIAELNADALGNFTGATYADGVHQNNAGHIATAGAIKSLFSVPQATEYPVVPQTRLLLNAQSNCFPNCAEIELTASAGTALSARGAAASSASLGPNLANLPITNASYSVGPGSNLMYNFSRALAVDLFFSATNTATLSNFVSGGGWGKSVAVPNQSWGGLLSILSIAEMNAVDFGYGPTWGTNWSLFPNWGFRLCPTDKAVNIEAAIAYTFDGCVVPWNQMQFGGTWGLEASQKDSSRNWHYSDDVGNATLVIPFTGSGLVLYIHCGTASGKVSVWLDGDPVYSAFDSYWNVPVSAFVRTLQLWPKNLASKLSDNYGPHTARIELLNTVNGSAVAPGAQNRRLAIYEAYAVDAR